MNALGELFSLCHQVIIYFNVHKGNSETVDEHIQDWGNGDEGKGISMDIYAKMVQRDTVIIIQLYPSNSTGFLLVFHYDLEKAAEQALAVLQMNSAEIRTI